MRRQCSSAALKILNPVLVLSLGARVAAAFTDFFLLEAGLFGMMAAALGGSGFFYGDLFVG